MGSCQGDRSTSSRSGASCRRPRRDRPLPRRGDRSGRGGPALVADNVFCGLFSSRSGHRCITVGTEVAPVCRLFPVAPPPGATTAMFGPSDADADAPGPRRRPGRDDRRRGGGPGDRGRGRRARLRGLALARRRGSLAVGHRCPRRGARRILRRGALHAARPAGRGGFGPPAGWRRCWRHAGTPRGDDGHRPEAGATSCRCWVCRRRSRRPDLVSRQGAGMGVVAARAGVNRLWRSWTRCRSGGSSWAGRPLRSPMRGRLGAVAGADRGRTLRRAGRGPMCRLPAATSPPRIEVVILTILWSAAHEHHCQHRRSQSSAVGARQPCSPSRRPCRRGAPGPTCGSPGWPWRSATAGGTGRRASDRYETGAASRHDRIWRLVGRR